MTVAPPDNPTPDEMPLTNTPPWSVRETFIGVGIIVCFTLGAVALSDLWRQTLLFQTFGIMALESIYALPVLGLVVLRKIPWSTFGLRNFDPKSLGLGCGLTLGGYVMIALHNILLTIFNLQTQGLEISRIFGQLKSPVGVVVAAVVLAPMTEELFFRGFLFAGLEQRYGWKKAAFASSLIFALFHLSLVSLIPTFILGFTFSYLYHQSKSIWPGILMHFLVNSFGICSVLVLSKLPIPGM